MRIAVFCVGNELMLDDGLGPAVFDEMQAYDCGPDVDVRNVGCMSLDFLPLVRDCDLLITVDALEGTGHEPGTVLRFAPEDAARRGFGAMSLHEMKLADLFDHAALLGYEAEGVCLGAQVENASPAQVCVGLTPAVHAAVPALVECVLAELVGRGVRVVEKASGDVVAPGFRHVMRDAPR